MKLVLVFDINSDLIDVPQRVIDNKDLLQEKFTTWIYNKRNNHKYWVTARDRTGKRFVGLRYRGDAFVEWLNRFVLSSSEEKASIIASEVCDFPDNLPTLYF